MMKKGRLCPEPPPQSPLTYPWAVFFLPWEDTSAPGYRETLPPARFGAPSPAVPRKILFRVESPGPSKASNTEEGLEGRGSSPSQHPPPKEPSPTRSGRVSSHCGQGTARLPSGLARYQPQQLCVESRTGEGRQRVGLNVPELLRMPRAIRSSRTSSVGRTRTDTPMKPKGMLL